jgi:hypothetical protein
MKLVTMEVVNINYKLHYFGILVKRLERIHFNIIIPSTYGSSKWPLSFRFSHQNPSHTSALPDTC